jgi:hypothetical protein
MVVGVMLWVVFSYSYHGSGSHKHKHKHDLLRVDMSQISRDRTLIKLQKVVIARMFNTVCHFA